MALFEVPNSFFDCAVSHDILGNPEATFSSLTIRNMETLLVVHPQHRVRTHDNSMRINSQIQESTSRSTNSMVSSRYLTNFTFLNLYSQRLADEHYIGGHVRFDIRYLNAVFANIIA